MTIYYSSKFYREYQRLSPRIKLTAEEKELIFRQNPFDIRLKAHRLTGALKGYWAFSINRKIRLIFEFKTPKTVWFHSIGPHDIYKL